MDLLHLDKVLQDFKTSHQQPRRPIQVPQAELLCWLEDLEHAFSLTVVGRCPILAQLC